MRDPERIERVMGLIKQIWSHYPDLRLTQLIMNVLAIKGPQNISNLTREVQMERGTGSRVTVRKKILELVNEGVVEKAEGHDYRLVE